MGQEHNTVHEFLRYKSLRRLRKTMSYVRWLSVVGMTELRGNRLRFAIMPVVLMLCDHVIRALQITVVQYRDTFTPEVRLQQEIRPHSSCSIIDDDPPSVNSVTHAGGWTVLFMK